MEPPSWALNVMRKYNGSKLRFFGEKIFTDTDKNIYQNRFLFHKDDVHNFIIPQLTQDEIIVANLNNVGQNNIGRERKKKNSGTKNMNGNAMEMKKAAGRVHNGLQVEIYTMAGWRFNVIFIHWDSKEELVIKGKEWRYVHVFGEIKPGDHVQVWSFRKVNNNGRMKLCLVVGKDSSSSSSAS